MRIRRARGIALALAIAASFCASRADAQPYYWRNHPRLRFGLSGVAGGFVGGAHGGMFGIEPRIGVQIDDMFAVYYQGQWTFGGFAPAPPTGWLAGFSFNEVMVDFTFANVFQFGIGPSLDFVWGCSANGGQPSCADSGPYLGGNARLAFLLGGGNWYHRHGLVFSIDVHPTLLRDDALGVVLFGIGGELY